MTMSATRIKSVLIDLNEAPSLPLFAQFAVVLAGVVTKWAPMQEHAINCGT